MRKFDLDIGAVAVFVILAFGFGGYIANIVKLVSADMAGITMMEIVRVIGIFMVPLGAILGFF